MSYFAPADWLADEPPPALMSMYGTIFIGDADELDLDFAMCQGGGIVTTTDPTIEYRLRMHGGIKEITSSEVPTESAKWISIEVAGDWVVDGARLGTDAAGPYYDPTVNGPSTLTYEDGQLFLDTAAVTTQGFQTLQSETILTTDTLLLP